MKIIQCNKCGKMFKIPRSQGDVFYTDLGGVFVFKDGESTCLRCHESSTFLIFETEDWIADRIFTTRRP